MLLGDDLSGSDQRETEVLVQILVGVVSSDIAVSDDGSLDDLDVAGHSSVSTSHIVVHLTDSTGEGEVSVLLVHIVSTASASVAQPDGEVLHLGGALLEDLSDIKDLTTGSLGLSQRLHVVPELGLSNNLIASEDLHSEDLGARILGGGSSTTNQLVEVHLRRVCDVLYRAITYVHPEGSDGAISLDHSNWIDRRRKFLVSSLRILLGNEL